MKKIKKILTKKRKFSKKHFGALGLTLFAFALPFGVPFFGMGVGVGNRTDFQSPPTSISIVPKISCIPLPPCLDSVPRCEIAEPAQGWCTPTVSPIVSGIPPLTPPPGCYYRKIVCTRACPLTNPNCCPPVLTCPSGSPQPHPTCMPIPYCLTHAPFCYIRVPVGGWCSPDITPGPHITTIPQPSHTPGCITRQICPLGVMCTPGNCMGCKTVTICPSGSPAPTGTCMPRPACLSLPHPCMIAEPIRGWCPPTISPIISSVPVKNVPPVGANPVVTIWSSFVHFFGF